MRQHTASLVCLKIPSLKNTNKFVRWNVAGHVKRRNEASGGQLPKFILPCFNIWQLVWLHVGPCMTSLSFFWIWKKTKHVHFGLSVCIHNRYLSVCSVIPKCTHIYTYRLLNLLCFIYNYTILLCRHACHIFIISFVLICKTI